MSNKEYKNKTNEKPPIWLGIIVMVAGVLPIVLGAKPTAGTPYWIVYLACSVFILGGLCIVGLGLGYAWVSKIIGPLIFVIFAVIATWIGFAPGERHCSSSISFSFFTKTESSGCQVFGYMGVLLWIIIIAIGLGAVKKWIKR